MSGPPKEITGTNTLLRLNTIIPTLEQQQKSFMQKNPDVNQAIPIYSKSKSPTTSDSVISQIQNSEISSKQLAYQQAIVDYNIAVIDSKSDITKYKRIAGANYESIIGPAVSMTGIASEEACKALCSPAKGCIGTTYTPGSGSIASSCSLVNGGGSLSPVSNPNSIVNLNILYYSLSNLQQKNAALMQSLDDVNVIIETNPNLMKDYIDLLNNTNTGVNMSYETLLQQRDQIRSLLDQYKFLDTDVKDAVIGINQSQMIYHFFIIVLLLLVFFICVIKFDIKLDPVNWIGLGLCLSFVVYIFGMFTISAMIALSVILYVILR
jgi:hypothetical protein